MSFSPVMLEVLEIREDESDRLIETTAEMFSVRRLIQESHHREFLIVTKELAERVRLQKHFDALKERLR